MSTVTDHDETAGAVQIDAGYADVDAAAAAAGLTAEQTARFRSDVASWAMEGMRRTPAELAAGAEVRAGRMSFDEYRRVLGV